jgi:small subunit ribosomal protein S3
VIRTWDSRWFAGKECPEFVHEDHRIREYLKKRFYHAGVAKIEIERAANKVKVRINCARPGIVIGKKGAEIESVRQELEKKFKREIFIDIQEVRKPELNAQLVAENVAGQLVRRVAFRRAMKKAVGTAMKFGAQGIKISCAGRLGGAEMARREWYREGRVPLHTLRADIDFGQAVAKTTYGIIGIQVLIFSGEILDEQDQQADH